MIRKTEYLCVFLAGGVIYGCMELLWRGFTHPSMIIAGGVCLLLIHLINQRYSFVNILVRCLFGAIIITSVELSAGVIVNIVLDLNVWDYSDIPGNFLGQICPLFSVMWFFISIPACYLSNVSRKFFDKLSAREQVCSI